MEKLARGRQIRLCCDEVGLAQRDRLVCGCRVRQHLLEPEWLWISDRVRLGLGRPASGRVAVGIVGLGQARLLVLASDPPGVSATFIARAGDKCRCEMDLELLAFYAAADRIASHEGDRVGGLGGNGHGVDPGRAAGDQPGEEAFLFLLFIISRRYRASGEISRGFVVGALPAFPNSGHRRVFLIENIRPGGDPGVGAGMCLQFA